MSQHEDATEFHRYAVDTFWRFDERWALAALHNLATALLTTDDSQAAATALLAAYDDPTARHLHVEIKARHRPPADDTPMT